MIWLELRKNNNPYDQGWNYKQSVWAPTRKRRGGNWPFWKLIQQVVKGDLIFHLHYDRHGHAKFEGYSIATEDGYTINDLPSEDKHIWDFTQTFYRADIVDFHKLEPAISLSDFFRDNDNTLREYFYNNKRLGRRKKRLFYVIQRNRLQSLNGAYFSEFNENLARMLIQNIDAENAHLSPDEKVETGKRKKELEQRIGHQEFSENVKINFGYKCCFPNCNVQGSGFLVSGHIDRWADNEELRGYTSNGLCLCLIHDKAFERGFFTLDNEFKIRVLNANKMDSYDWLFSELVKCENLEIKARKIDPFLKALEGHWKRIGFLL